MNRNLNLNLSYRTIGSNKFEGKKHLTLHPGKRFGNVRSQKGVHRYEVRMPFKFHRVYNWSHVLVLFITIFIAKDNRIFSMSPLFSSCMWTQPYCDRSLRESVDQISCRCSREIWRDRPVLGALVLEHHRHIDRSSKVAHLHHSPTICVLSNSILTFQPKKIVFLFKSLTRNI